MKLRMLNRESRSLSIHLLMLVPVLVGPVATSAVAQHEDADESLIPSPVFSDHFESKTMRVDYFHSGNATDQHVALDCVVSDGPWAGTRHQLIDTLDRGEYTFEVRDQKTEQLLYSRGFCSVCGEWQTTAMAKQRWGTFHESLRFPWPQRPVQVTLKQRVTGQWQEIWSDAVDPRSRFVTDAETPRRDTVWNVFTNGDPAEKVDIVILGDGFTSEETPRFHKAVLRLTEALFAVEPFLSRRTDFNVRAIDVPATDSGVSRPREKVFRRSPLGCQYNTFDLARYALTFENQTVRDVAAQAPYDYLVILLNEKAYGGGGIYNDQTVVAAHHQLASYVLIHEFGHHLAGLADEYYSSNVAYETGQPIEMEPWEPNITALRKGSSLKWKNLVTAGVPIPTPWNKKAFELQSKQTAPADQHGTSSRATDGKRQEGAESKSPRSILDVLTENRYFGQVGAFEGARYESKGLFRPTVNCAMFSRTTVEFCPVCRQAIEQVIDMHTQTPH